MDLHADTLPLPGQIPDDAVAVLAFDDTQRPPRWRVVAIASQIDVDDPQGAALDATAAQDPTVADQCLLAVPIGGSVTSEDVGDDRARVVTVSRQETREVHVQLSDVDPSHGQPPDDGAGAPDPGGAPLEPGP
jgi:hypothetical protein